MRNPFLGLHNLLLKVPLQKSKFSFLNLSRHCGPYFIVAL